MDEESCDYDKHIISMVICDTDDVTFCIGVTYV